MTMENMTIKQQAKGTEEVKHELVLVDVPNGDELIEMAKGDEQVREAIHAAVLATVKGKAFGRCAYAERQGETADDEMNFIELLVAAGTGGRMTPKKQAEKLMDDVAELQGRFNQLTADMVGLMTSGEVDKAMTVTEEVNTLKGEIERKTAKASKLMAEHEEQVAKRRNAKKDK